MKDETVEYKGNVYEIGQNYLFSDGGECWTYTKLKWISPDNSFPFVNSSGAGYLLMKEVGASQDLGTITPVPIKLIDGSAYMFETTLQNNCQGYFSQGKLYYKNGWERAENCINIRRMLVEPEQ